MSEKPNGILMIFGAAGPYFQSGLGLQIFNEKHNGKWTSLSSFNEKHNGILINLALSRFDEKHNGILMILRTADFWLIGPSRPTHTRMQAGTSWLSYLIWPNLRIPLAGSTFLKPMHASSSKMFIFRLEKWHFWKKYAFYNWKGDIFAEITQKLDLSDTPPDFKS